MTELIKKKSNWNQEYLEATMWIEFFIHQKFPPIIKVITIFKIWLGVILLDKYEITSKYSCVLGHFLVISGNMFSTGIPFAWFLLFHWAFACIINCLWFFRYNSMNQRNVFFKNFTSCVTILCYIYWPRLLYSLFFCMHFSWW